MSASVRAGSADMQLLQKLAGLSGIINQICDISGSAGLSYGVLHEGQIVHTEHFGYRDVEAKVKADDDTLYYIASLTKAITAAAVGILVDDGEVTWDTKISEILPEFHQRNKDLNAGTLTDLLAHRMGFAGKNCFWIQGSQRLLLPKEQNVPTANYLESVVPFRSKWKYSNWGYAVAGEAIERISGESYGSFLKKRLFTPLGMKRTTADDPPSENLAEAYMVHQDGTPAKIPRPEIGSSTVIGAAGGVKSSIADLLLFYKSILSTNTNETCQQTPSSASVLKSVHKMFSPHIVIGDNPMDKMAYGLGWVRTQLPSTLGLIGMNDMYLGPSMPLVGKSSKKVVLSHNGNLSGFLSSIMVIPETETAIIVLGNSMPFTDPPDLVGQLILEAILEEPNPNDYVQLAKDARDAHAASYATLTKSLETGKGEPSSLPLETYVGRYSNSIGNFVLDLSLQAGHLRMVVQDIDAVSYDLQPYAGQTFWWGPPDQEAEEAGQAMFPRTYAGFHLITFQVDGDNVVQSLTWPHDPDLPEGEVFTKAATDSQTKQSAVQKIMGPLGME